MSKTLVLHHSADWDGWVSGAIIAEKFYDPVVFPLNYGQLPYDDDYAMEMYDNIVIADFSLPDDMMIYNRGRITWIDHHAPVINRLLSKGYTFYGLKCTDNSVSAAYLAWLQYHSVDEEVPYAVKLISTYDVFDKKSPLWDDALKFQCYMRTLPFSYENASVHKWSVDKVNHAIDTGDAILKVKAQEEERLFKNYSHDIEYNGYHGKLVFSSDMSSMICMNEVSKTDFILMLNLKSNGIWQCSVRVGDQSNFNACTFAQNFNGGGHVKAAGCIFTTEQFNEFIKNIR